ncbi:MAG: hypothetical protein OXR73_14665 [Myxococcales bacterium]|nr:hypothetical protein [Myxococcales bacterium]
MQRDSRSNASDSCNRNADGGTETLHSELVIVGFGYSVIPLVRELQREGRRFVVISDGESVWEQLERADRLDFDLVSSAHSSLFSFELVKQRKVSDSYLTAREFLEHQRALRRTYAPETLVRDRVVEIQNHSDHSLVLTRDGRRFHAKHVVVATAFKRELMGVLSEFDFDATSGKTVVINTSGDSGNMIAAKLIPRDNRVIMLTNGMLTLDKLVRVLGKDYTLDQLEYHNVRHISKFFYQFSIDAGTNLAPELGPVGRLMFGKNFRVAYPVCTRRRLSLKNKDALPNGMIAVKVWPIDTFKRLFDGEQLDEKIAAGYLLNDLAFYVDQGLLELWPRSECEVDQENKVLRWNGREVAFDHFIDGERETPNLPTITRMEPTPRPYEYAYRDSFMGVMPRDLNNIYFVGLSRPTTGGLANVVEMQCLLVHRVLSDPSFHRSITSSIDARLKDYDRKYYPNKEHGPTDHLVWYGSYTDDIGRLLGIAPTLGKCRSLTDVLQYYFFPNGSLKFRCEGSYRVEGAKELLDDIWAEYDRFRILVDYPMFFALFQATAMAGLVLSPLPLWLSVPLCVAQFYNPLVPLVLGNSVPLYGYLNFVLAGGLIASLLLASPSIAAGTLGFTLLFVLLNRKLGWGRAFFNDLSFRRKPEFREFYERYKKAFLRVFPTRSPQADAPREEQKGLRAERVVARAVQDAASKLSVPG